MRTVGRGRSPCFGPYPAGNNPLADTEYTYAGSACRGGRPTMFFGRVARRNASPYVLIAFRLSSVKTRRSFSGLEHVTCSLPLLS